MKNKRNIFIDWYRPIDQAEVAFMKKVQLRSQQNIYSAFKKSVVMHHEFIRDTHVLKEQLEIQ